MIIGIPKEIKQQENRVSLVPSAAHQLARRGPTLLVQKNAGVGSGYPDEDYLEAGAKIVQTAEDLFAKADMIVKVKEPLPAEYGLLRKGQILFTYLHLAASKSLTEALLKSGVTGVAYETIQVGNRLPLLEPMSEIAGRLAPPGSGALPTSPDSACSATCSSWPGRAGCRRSSWRGRCHRSRSWAPTGGKR